MSNETLNFALKEWSVVVHSMKRQIHHLILRKGGLADKGQEFRMEQDKFFLFPTYEHQDGSMIAAPFRGLLDETLACQSSRDELKIECWAKVKDCSVVKSLDDLLTISSGHIWSEKYIRMRWNYKPEKILYMVQLNIYILKVPVTIQNPRRYGGCRSWVQLDEVINPDIF